MTKTSSIGIRATNAASARSGQRKLRTTTAADDPRTRAIGSTPEARDDRDERRDTDEPRGR